MTREVRVFGTPRDVDRAAAGEFVTSIVEAAAARGRAAVALSGGTTPRGLYELLAADRAVAARLSWEAVHVFWGDERCVPPDDPASNYGMARATLLDHVPLPAANVHRIRGEAPTASDAATDYERELRAFFRPDVGATPRFDVVLLGVGSDGHTASLFPGAPALQERARLALPAVPPTSGPDRVTLTLPVLNAAACIIVLAVGERKAPVLRAVLRDEPGARAFPIARVNPTGRLVWMLDAAAAAGTGAPADASVHR